eukprot:CAMPEP_0179930092 /NCGR_PEP_ID=MMETSP0983-20121128/9839_1 /TAXON_ID=483367 /ORGANISM="non described non described, Strain CCMP 2436" /LENGTH=169 /DNA_ID=CAMNT_0021834185 /DNA_START=65 /DNA_END=575 /DNA_ORIENTATION=-
MAHRKCARAATVAVRAAVRPLISDREAASAAGDEDHLHGRNRASHAGARDADENATCSAVAARCPLETRPGRVPHASHTVHRRDKRRPGHARARTRKAQVEPADPGLPRGERTCLRAASAKGADHSSHVLDVLARAGCVRALDRPQAPVRARAWQDREGPVQRLRAAGV